jgi:hypothetical protein
LQIKAAQWWNQRWCKSFKCRKTMALCLHYHWIHLFKSRYYLSLSPKNWTLHCDCIYAYGWWLMSFPCLISAASSFESKWKIFTRKLPRRKKDEDMSQSDALLQHRRRALNKVEESLDCSYLETDWKI